MNMDMIFKRGPPEGFLMENPLIERRPSPGKALKWKAIWTWFTPVVLPKGFGVCYGPPNKGFGGLSPWSYVTLEAKMWVLVHLKILNLFPKQWLYWSNNIFHDFIKVIAKVWLAKRFDGFAKGSNVSAVPLFVLLNTSWTSWRSDSTKGGLKGQQPLGSNRFAALFNANHEIENGLFIHSHLSNLKMSYYYFSTWFLRHCTRLKARWWWHTP